MSSAVIFPVMFILILIAKPLVIVLLTERWLDAAPFMQILCMGYMFNHISAINLNMLYVEGRSDLALKLEFLKKGVAISILFISVLWGIWGICIGQAFYAFIATILNSFYTKKLIGVSYIDQLNDYGKVLIYALIPFCFSFFFLLYISNVFVQIFCGIFLYTFIYFIVNNCVKSNFYIYSKKLFIKQQWRK